MDFIKEEEAPPLLALASLTLSSPIPSQPFPFLKLPREIRDMIYDYAILRNTTRRLVISNHQVFDRPQRPVNAYLGCANFWGTISTELFHVNYQIYHEALELFYSTSFFDFTIGTTVSLVNATIRDTLTPWARNLIRNIGLHMYFFCSHSDHFTLDYEEERRKGFEAAVKLLPNVKRVELTLEVSGITVPEHQVKELVARAFRIVSPFRKVDRLILKDHGDETAQQNRIWRKVREALGCLGEERGDVTPTLH